ncbi:DUF2264 domain-containing protein [Streptomyces sp. NPDC003077]|uniref:DUF2264 domain-containing protein n=1 Tax=Streptomyces sp. NPDC003077 TaxID=3154443 RepID=UPI0033B4DE39
MAPRVAGGDASGASSVPFPLPPEDRELSPYTGWTRAHWEAAADGLLDAVAPYASERGGLINLPGHRASWSGARSDGLEGYARTFLAAAFRVAGSGGEDPHGYLPRYARGLAAGTEHPVDLREADGGHPDSWPLMAGTQQAVVESASVALGLRLTRPWLWDTLDEGVRARVVEWLLPALGPSPMDNNWWLFGLTVGGFLLDAGIETTRAQAAVDRALTRIDEWYRGDGWYSDGANRSFDHYNGWALHFYPVLHAHLSGDRALLATYGERLHAQLDGLTRTFDANGAPMPFGRSLTYRFAATAAPWLGALTGHTPLAPGATRRLASGALRHFLDRGAVGRDGLLSLGWYGPYGPILQGYSGPASPYWASKGFVGLLVPATHPVWNEPEEALPAETADAVTALGTTGMLVHSTAADGLVRLHNHGSNAPWDLPDPYYGRFAYSTRTGPVATPRPTGLLHPDDLDWLVGEEGAGASDHAPVSGPAVDSFPDNHFGLLVGDGAQGPDEGTDGDHAKGGAADGPAWTVRGPAEPLGHGPGWAASAHTPRRSDGEPLAGVRVLSVTVAHGRAELRAHLVTGAALGTPVRQSGWAVTEGGLTAQLHPVRGYTGDARHLEAGRTPFGARSRMACLDGAVGAAEGALFLSLASLTAEDAPVAVRALADVEVTGSGVTGSDIRVTWQDGTGHVLTLGPERVAVRVLP